MASAACEPRDSAPVTLRIQDRAMLRACWSPDGRFLALALCDVGVRVVDADTGAALADFRGAADAFDVLWAPCGRQLAALCGDETGARMESNELRVFDAARAQLAGVTRTSADPRWWPYHFCWSPCGRWLAARAGSDNLLRVWDATSAESLGEPVAVLADAAAQRVYMTHCCHSWSACGRWLVSRVDDALALWDITDPRDPRLARTLRLDPLLTRHQRRCAVELWPSAALSPCGRFLACSLRDCVACVPSGVAEDPARDITVFARSTVGPGCWSPCGRWFVLARWKARTWRLDIIDAREGARVLVLRNFLPADTRVSRYNKPRVSWCPSGRRLLCAFCCEGLFVFDVCAIGSA